MLRIDLPRELENDLALVAIVTERPIHFHIRQAILEYLDDLEDRVAAARWLEEAEADHGAINDAETNEDGGPDGTRTRDLRRDRPAF